MIGLNSHGKVNGAKWRILVSARCAVFLGMVYSPKELWQNETMEKIAAVVIILMLGAVLVQADSVAGMLYNGYEALFYHSVRVEESFPNVNPPSAWPFPNSAGQPRRKNRPRRQT